MQRSKSNSIIIVEDKIQPLLLLLQEDVKICQELLNLTDQETKKLITHTSRIAENLLAVLNTLTNLKEKFKDNKCQRSNLKNRKKGTSVSVVFVDPDHFIKPITVCLQAITSFGFNLIVNRGLGFGNNDADNKNLISRTSDIFGNVICILYTFLQHYGSSENEVIRGHYIHRGFINQLRPIINQNTFGLIFIAIKHDLLHRGFRLPLISPDVFNDDSKFVETIKELLKISCLDIHQGDQHLRTLLGAISQTLMTDLCMHLKTPNIKEAIKYSNVATNMMKLVDDKYNHHFLYEFLIYVCVLHSRNIANYYDSATLEQLYEKINWLQKSLSWAKQLNTPKSPKFIAHLNELNDDLINHYLQIFTLNYMQIANQENLHDYFCFYHNAEISKLKLIIELKDMFVDLDYYFYIFRKKLKENGVEFKLAKIKFTVEIMLLNKKNVFSKIITAMEQVIAFFHTPRSAEFDYPPYQPEISDSKSIDKEKGEKEPIEPSLTAREKKYRNHLIRLEERELKATELRSVVEQHPNQAKNQDSERHETVNPYELKIKITKNLFHIYHLSLAKKMNKKCPQESLDEAKKSIEKPKLSRGGPGIILLKITHRRHAAGEPRKLKLKMLGGHGKGRIRFFAQPVEVRKEGENIYFDAKFRKVSLKH